MGEYPKTGDKSTTTIGYVSMQQSSYGAGKKSSAKWLWREQASSEQFKHGQSRSDWCRVTALCIMIQLWVVVVQRPGRGVITCRKRTADNMHSPSQFTAAVIRTATTITRQQSQKNLQKDLRQCLTGSSSSCRGIRHTQTHTHTFFYVYISVCLCVSTWTTSRIDDNRARQLLAGQIPPWE